MANIVKRILQTHLIFILWTTAQSTTTSACLQELGFQKKNVTNATCFCVYNPELLILNFHDDNRVQRFNISELKGEFTKVTVGVNGTNAMIQTNELIVNKTLEFVPTNLAVHANDHIPIWFKIQKHSEECPPQCDRSDADMAAVLGITVVVILVIIALLLTVIIIFKRNHVLSGVPDSLETHYFPLPV